MKHHRSFLALVGVLTLLLPLAACATDEPAGPYEVLIVVPDDHGGQKFSVEPLDVRDIRTLACERFAFETGSEIFATVGHDTGTVSAGRPLDLAVVREGNVYRPLDADALLILTSAHHLLASRQAFDELGLAELEPPFPALRVVFFPRRIDAGAFGTPTTDNAFFSDSIGGFAILRSNVLRDLPLSANRGVLAHEFTHAIFAHLTRNNPPAILLAGLQEGLADVHGAHQSGDPDFVGKSVPQLSQARDLSVRRVFDARAETTDVLQQGPYLHGAVVSSTFWDYRGRLVRGRGATESDARRRMAHVAFAGVRDMTPFVPHANQFITTQDIENTFWEAAVRAARDQGDEEVFCEALRDHFAETEPSSPTRTLCK